MVSPPRSVWERGELAPTKLTFWSFLVTAAGQAMLEVLPQLQGGCINYWEAGNWALNHASEPVGLKQAKEHRRVHLHLLGRGRRSEIEAEAGKSGGVVTSVSVGGATAYITSGEIEVPPSALVS